MLKLTEVRKSYRKFPGISKVNITIFPGKLYLFLGENGSGKSTTIKLISRVIFNGPKDGTIQNNYKKIVYLPDRRSYPKLLKVKTFLEYYLGKDVSKEEVLAAMERYQLPNKSIESLSKGMHQKIGILQAILSKGDLYLFDEPTDGLDLDSIKLFKEDLATLLKEGKTIVISTHNKQQFKDLGAVCYKFKEGICE